MYCLCVNVYCHRVTTQLQLIYHTIIFATGFRKILKYETNFMKIRPVGAELFRADGRTDMTKLIVAFRNFANAPKKKGIIQ